MKLVLQHNLKFQILILVGNSPSELRPLPPPSPPQLQQVAEEKAAVAAQLRAVSQTLRDTQNRCHWLEGQLQVQAQVNTPEHISAVTTPASYIHIVFLTSNTKVKLDYSDTLSKQVAT